MVLGKTEEAGEYYQKCIDARVQVYEQTGATPVLLNIIDSLDNTEDN